MKHGASTLYKANIFLLMLSLCCGMVFAQTNAIENPSYEDGLTGWRTWSRTTDAIRAGIVQDPSAPDGSSVMEIRHTGDKDWSLEPSKRLTVAPGDILDLSIWGLIQGTGNAALCLSLWDKENENRGWAYGAAALANSGEWKQVQCRVVIPEGVVSAQPRVIGDGKSVVRMDLFSVCRAGNVSNLRAPGLPDVLTLANPSMELRFDTKTLSAQVRCRSSRKVWEQAPALADLILKNVSQADERALTLELLHIPTDLKFRSTLQLDPDKAEYLITIDTPDRTSPAFNGLAYPPAYRSQPGEYLVIPMNEGISYPVEDDTIDPMYLIAYGGHGICMAFWGATDGQSGYSAIIETPDDSGIRIDRHEKKLTVFPQWEPQLGKFGYERRLRYSFFGSGGYVGMAKRYRQYAQAKGIFKTLREKEKEIPATARLAGAVNVWNWDTPPGKMVDEMRAAGIEHILWSNGGSSQEIKKINEMGVLSSRYDIYQDIMDPGNREHLAYWHGDWIPEAWPHEIITDKNGNWRHGWSVEGKDGQWYDCGVICDRFSLKYAAQKIPAELAEKPYLARFIDTTTASPWQECWHPDHPMTRADSRKWKMKLLDHISRDQKLVTGCETGHDASVPYLHFFEGMMSLGPYRVPDAGRDMMRVWEEVPENLSKFQLGHNYRLPLWELVFHDCTVSYWYWGDYNNKLPALWDKRDLFNLLYGVPPMFMFTHDQWLAHKERFVQSYQNTCPVIREIAYEEMLDHRFLTPDRNVQQTRFANGYTVVVNFGPTSYVYQGQKTKTTIPAMGFHVEK
ncbi:MAG: hypothetical protein IJU47_09075 [Verrucomicrobia bacterium]|nr:hypothetical protein [Verrucomicrobiota bacterium]